MSTGASPCAARPPPRKPSPSSTTALRRSPCCATSACVPASGFDILKALFERLPDVSGAMVSGEFNSQILQEAEQEGYLVLRKPLEPAGCMRC